MKIRTKFYFSTLFLLIMIVLIGSVQLLAIQRRNTVFAKQRMADKIVDHITGLNRLTFDYIMDPSERARTQWTRTHRQLSKIIAAASYDTPSEQQMLRKIQRNHANLQVVFSIFIEKLGESTSDDEMPARELLDRLTKQLLIKSGDIVSGAHQLSNLVRNNLKKIQQQNSIFIFSTVIVISILIILNSILIAKSITRPIDALTAGARHFGEGNLEYRIANITGDEIGELSQAFNRMARNLNRITVSKEKLIREMEERKKIQEELRQAHKMEAIGTLAGGIAHDFNNILGIIIGNTELALEDVDEWHPARSYLDEIKTAGLRARDVVRQLLSFSRKSEQQRKPLNMVPLIDETMKLLRSSIPTTIEIRSDVADHLGSINADATQIQQVIINLCTNAAQAMEEEGGLMEVSLTQVDIDETALGLNNTPAKGPYVQIAVRDTGHGIDTKIQNRIFDPYFTTKEVSKGSGMGLAIVHGIVTSHDGAISVDSEIGKGTTKKLLLPVCKQRDTEEETVPNALPTGTEKILFVDDEKSIVKMMTKMLGRLGYQIESKTNPIEALALFQSKPHAFDLVITDMNMPQMTGAKLAEKIMETRNDLPIIVCTGHSTLIDEEKAKKLGIAALAIKPIVKQQIAMTIRRVLDASKIELPTAHRMD